METFHANGKLLLSGEYFVLDGALALALPARFGQALRVTRTDEPGWLHWESFDEQGKRWFEGRYALPGLAYDSGSDAGTGRRLETLLQAAAARRPDHWDSGAGFHAQCRLDFPRAWGLGTSSTLISLVAQWTGVDPFYLLSASFGGSGYDVACATAKGPLFYQRRGGDAHYVDYPFRPAFRETLFFAYLGQKQDTRAGIGRYRERVSGQPGLVRRISEISARLACAPDLERFEAALKEHERLVSDAIGLPRARDVYFPDFPGEVKSLGAWGGDFVLMTHSGKRAGLEAYLRGKGIHVLFGYDELILET